MLTSVRSLMAATVLAGSAFASAPALAQEGEQFTISGNAAVVSEYRFRGVDLSGGDIAVQGGADVSHASGFYIGTWGSSLDEDTVGYGHTELDVYGGWSGNPTEAVTAGVGAIYYLYPNAGPGDFDYVEFYGSLGYALGPAEATAGIAYAPDQDSLGGTDNLYLYTDVGVGIPNTPITINGHLGYTDGFLTYTPDGTAWDYSIGADFAITPNLTVGAAYIGVEGDPTTLDDMGTPVVTDDFIYDFTDDTFVATLSVSF